MDLQHQDWKQIYVSLDNRKHKKEKNKKGPSNNLDNTNLDTFKNKKVEVSFSTKMRQARNNKNITQKELAQKINVKPAVINEYESGKAIPNPKILNNIKKILGI